MSTQTANRIFEKWKADLAQLDRSRNSVRDNFDRLFGELCDNDVSFEEAEQILPKAAQRHFPNKSAAKNTWERCKNWAKCSFEEWHANWNEDIRAKATSSFYEFYPLTTIVKPKRNFGPFSPAEYAKQRAYADSFETLPSKQEREANDNNQR